MTDKCAYPKCGKELIHIQGRKKKKYCGSECRLLDWQTNNPKKPKKKLVPIEQHQKSVVVVEDENGQFLMGDKKVKFVWADKKENKPDIKWAVATDAAYDGRNNQFENAARGRDTNGINNDELIHQYEEELSKLGDGQFAKARKKWLTQQIQKLKQIS